MNRFVTTFMPLIDHYGYWAVAAAILPEGFGIPAPGESALIAASVVASRGDMSFAAILIVAFSAALIGNTIGYGLGYYGGRPLVLRYGKYVFVTEESLKRTEKFFLRYGPVIVVTARFFDVFRQLNGIVAGLTRMPHLRFQCFNIIGAGIWVGFWGGLSYGFGHNIGGLRHVFVGAKYALFAALFATLCIVVIHCLRKKKGPTG